MTEKPLPPPKPSPKPEPKLPFDPTRYSDPARRDGNVGW